MKETHNWSRYKTGTIIIEIQSLIPEKFLNLLWKNNVKVKKVKRISLTSVIMEVPLRDYKIIEEMAHRTKTKVKILKREGIAFFILKARRKLTLFGGILLFIGIIYFLSTFIWGIDITTDKDLTPYEIRQQLGQLGIKPGISKRDIDVNNIEENISRNNDEIMWIRARIEGSRLKITVAERQSPPQIVKDDTPCDLVASKAGQVVRVYTEAGTPVVKPGDVIKAGQLLVKGEQGKEGSIYQVHAKGNIIARTFYEDTEEIAITGTRKKRTGKYIENYYIQIGNKKIYIKKQLNKFQTYDKIEDNKHFIKKEVFYETKDEQYKLDSNQVIKDTLEKLNKKIRIKLDKSVNIVDKIEDTKVEGDKCIVRLVLVGEENIALSQDLQ